MKVARRANAGSDEAGFRQPFERLGSAPDDHLEPQRRKRLGVSGTEKLFVNRTQFFTSEIGIALDDDEQHRMRGIHGKALLTSRQVSVEHLLYTLGKRRGSISRQRSFM